MKIGEVAEKAGLPASTLRYYEDIGLIPAPQRKSGQRIYDEDIFTRLAIIQLAQDSGFKLEEIRFLLTDSTSHSETLQRWKAFSYQKITEIEAIIQQYQNMKQLLQQAIACGCVDMDDCQILLEKL